MSVFPIAINANGVPVLIVGGGQVAERKAIALLSAGASIRVIAPNVSSKLLTLGEGDDNLEVLQREYSGPADIASATLVIAATSSREVNARVCADARAAHRLVNIVDAPATGSFSTMAVHRAGDLTVGVSTGSVPSAARAIRDRIAGRFDGRYAEAITTCATLRAETLSNGPGGRARWADLHARVIGGDFCDIVEDGSFAARVASCR